jgi:hypothetical protein
MSNQVKCADCRNFTPTLTSKNAAGLCGVMQAYYQKYKAVGKLMPPKTHDEAYRALGDKHYWPYAERHCQKFEAL